MNREQRRAAAKAKRHGYGQTKHSTRVIVDPLTYVLDGARPLREELSTLTQLKHRQAFESIRTGQGTTTDLSFLIEMVNMSQLYAEQQGQTEAGWAAFETAIRAKHALKAVKERYARMQKVGFSGLEMQDIEVCLDMHEQMLKLIPVTSIEKAQIELQKRMKLVRSN